MKNLTILLIALMLSACTSVPMAYVDFDHDHTFKNYKTFSWAHSPPLISDGDIRLEKSLEYTTTQAIKSALLDQGFSFMIDQSEADFLVAYTVGSRENVKIYPTETCVYSNKENWLWGKQYHSYYFDLVLDEDLKGNFNKSIIALDIFDAKSRVPIWHSKISKVSKISEASQINEAPIFSDIKELNNMASKLVEQFPPK